MPIGNSDTARKEILARIRKAQGRGASSRPSQAEVAAVETYIAAHPRGPLPDVEDDLVARFRARAESMQSTTELVERRADVPGAAARYLAAHGLPRTGCLWPALADLDWAGAGLALEARGAEDRDLVGSGPATPAAASLLPETHIAVVPVARIVKHMEDGWALARAEFGQLPRLVNFISGPSRTGDIDQTIVLGAHGPYRVHMILVRDAG
jgi:L-lactate dehydrogenase complex protein LldG